MTITVSKSSLNTYAVCPGTTHHAHSQHGASPFRRVDLSVSDKQYLVIFLVVFVIVGLGFFALLFFRVFDVMAA